VANFWAMVVLKSWAHAGFVNKWLAERLKRNNPMETKRQLFFISFIYPAREDRR